MSDETGMIRRAVIDLAVVKVAKDLAEKEETDDDDANHWSNQTLAFPNN